MRYPGFVGFEADNEEWLVSEGGTAGYSLTGGNPNGFFYGDDAGGKAWYFHASDSFIMETRKAYGRSLRFDLKQEAVKLSPDHISDLILTDGKTTLTFKTAYKPATTWTTYAVRLDESSGWKKGLEPTTKTDMQVVLQNLIGLRIRGDYKFGPDRGSLDNVTIY
ncbi:hypothetical protein GCM10028818_05440 [Spirosoma horti]